ncbi:A24 family peptidase [Cognatiyoonia sp. IB215446]|uniref:A24 family peptidase n=1 Tax=Cognatiyoonia sp. IB215446 TaxID=3097355 RepID=UPI002A0F70FF|nr:A24 family peptidase [Cognatiyoonia sp. IB215446]MDX8348792.1 A24 family peptidase [Cognatiyoonia sp. IB215446]
MFLTVATYAMAVVIITAMVIEARTGKIPNWLTIIPVLLFVVLVFVAPPAHLWWQLAFAAAIFGFGLFLFSSRGFGAGAVKLMGGVALFMPLTNGFIIAIAFIVIMLVSTFLVVQVRRVFGSEDSTWHVLAKPVVPMSLPIGLTAFFAFLVS